MKKHVWLTILILVTVIFAGIATAQAEIIPPYGEGQIGLQGVVLCESLTVRKSPNTSSDAVKKLQSGDHVIVYEQSDGWAKIFLSDDVDAEPAGWVNADYLAIDPAWYHTEGKTTVYAYDDTSAPKVALLDDDTVLPVLRQEGDWIIVSLRGAVGFIRL
jgi:uncharacterized protein YgiM (DUF1202 family)